MEVKMCLGFKDGTRRHGFPLV